MSMETQIIVDCRECDRVRKLKQELLDAYRCLQEVFDISSFNSKDLKKENAKLEKEIGK